MITVFILGILGLDLELGTMPRVDLVGFGLRFEAFSESGRIRVESGQYSRGHRLGFTRRDDHRKIGTGM